MIAASHPSGLNCARPRRSKLAAIALISVSAVGCASFSADGGLNDVKEQVAVSIKQDVAWARSDVQRSQLASKVTSLLSKELSVEDAVQIALLNNRDLQAEFDTLGIGEAELVQAGRVPNPGFSFGKSSRGDEREIERGFHFNLARLIFMPAMVRMETRRFERTQRRVAIQVLDLASRTRKAWFELVAAQEMSDYMNQVKRTAAVSAQLARRMARIGNFSKYQQIREQSFYADATVNQARSDHAVTVAREQLTRLMGLWGDQLAYKLPKRMPDLPKQAKAVTGIVRTALQQRLDVQAAKIGVEQIAGNLGMIKTQRFFNAFEVGFVRNSSNLEPRQTGWEAGLELPIFDWGGAKLTKAKAVYRQAVNQATHTAINARSEVRQAYSAYRTSFDIARHYRDEIVPLRKRISEENIYRYNGMLIGVFELLADARVQITAVTGYITAQRDFWMAKADLDAAMVGKPSLSTMSGASMSAGAEGGGH